MEMGESASTGLVNRAASLDLAVRKRSLRFDANAANNDPSLYCRR
jgi:hypothetical protein